MFRGTTPCFAFRLPFNAEKVIKDLIITIKNRKIKTVNIEKRKEDCEFKDNCIIVGLTQADTLLFEPKEVLDIQLRLLTKGQSALASPIFNLTVEKILTDGILGSGLQYEIDSASKNIADKEIENFIKEGICFDTEFPDICNKFSPEFGEIYPVKGDKGTTFIPNVDADGNISWSNEDGLPNPPTQNIKGNAGDITPEYRQMYQDTIKARDDSITNAQNSEQSKQGAEQAEKRATTLVGETERIVAAVEPQVNQNKTDIQNLKDNKADKTEIPTKLPNPNQITFTGAVTGEYDGSKPIEINIPEGGSGGTINYNELVNKPTVGGIEIKGQMKKSDFTEPEVSVGIEEPIGDNFQLFVDEDAEAIPSSYNDLNDKPKINQVTLTGNKTLEELGIQQKGDYTTKQELDSSVNTALEDAKATGKFDGKDGKPGIYEGENPPTDDSPVWLKPTGGFVLVDVSKEGA